MENKNFNENNSPKGAPVFGNTEKKNFSSDASNSEIASATISEILNSLQNLQIFKNLQQDEILEILKISQIKKFGKQQTIFCEGDDDERTMYVIIEGRVEILAESLVTKEKVSLFSAGKGLTFGEMSFLDAQPRSATIRTTEPTEVFIINRKYFDALIEQKPKVAAKFILGLSDILSRRLRATDQKLKYSI